MKKIFIKKIIYPFLGIALFIGVWAILAKIINYELKLPSPYKALLGLFELLGSKTFYVAVLATLGRAVKAFIISFIIAFVLAIISSFSLRFKLFIAPIITIIRSLPTISIILLVLIWLKSNTAPGFIAGLIVFPTMYASFCSAIEGVDKDIISMSKLYKVSAKDLIFRFYVPNTIPSVFDTVKSNISLNFKVVIASEVLAQTMKSIGVNMQFAKSYLDTSNLMAWTVVAVVISFMLESIITLIKYLLTRRFNNE